MKSLQKLSYKTLFTILFLALAGIVFFSKIGQPAKKISAAWWNDSWHYRQLFPISNTSGSDQNDMVVKINLDTLLLISSGKTQSSCNDIRLTDTIGNVLQHFITQCNTQTTNIYVKIPVIPSSGSGIYLYYGNSTATNIETSDIFTYFDGFESATPKDVWTTTQLSVNIASDFSNKGNRAIKFIAQGPSFDNLYQTFSSSNNWTNHYLEYEFYANQAGAHWLTDPRNSSSSRMNAWKSFSITATTWNTFSEDLNTNTYKDDIKSIMYFTSGDDINRNIYIDNFRIRHCLSTITVGATQSEESGGGPIAYWKFDEGSGNTTYDSTSNKYDGTFLSEPVWKNEDECVSGKCLSFDNVDDGVSINQNFTNLKDYTMSAWINIKGNHKNYDGTIMSSGNWNSEHWSFGISNSNNQFKLRKWDGINNDTKNYPFKLNEWTHVSITKEGSILTYYVNGESIGSTSGLSGNLISNATNTAIGRDTYTAGHFTFNGLIDEPKIYSYARTPNQIKQDYNSRGSTSGSGVNLGVRSNTTPEIKSSLVAYYKFDENNGTTVYDSSGNHNTGTFGTSNSAPTWNQGKINKAVNFDGNDLISITDNTSLKPSQISISGWFKTNESKNQYIINKGDGTATGGGYNIYIYSDNRLAFWFYNGNSNLVLIHTGTSSIQLNTWHFFQATYDGVNSKIYLDGTLKSTSPNTSGFTQKNTNINIGHLFNGLIDELKIYNTALTLEEVKKDHNTGSAIQFGTTNQTIDGTTTSLEYCIPGDTSYCAPPIAEWNFEENTGVTTKDTSGNNNTGNILNLPQWTPGKVGSALNFNANNKRVTITNPISSSGYTTLSIWYKRSETDASTSWRTLVGHTTANIHHLIINSSNRNIGIFDGSWRDFEYNPPNDNKWHHYEVIYNNGTSATLYVDGIYKNQITTTLNLSVNPIGSIGNWNSGNYWAGPIDQIRIYSYARTPAQIAYDYNKGAPIGHWKLNECQGNTTYDSSGNNNHGTINIGINGAQNSLGTCAIGTSAAWTNGANGKINSSLSFDGVDDYVNLGNNPIMNLTSSGTVSSWIFIPSSWTSGDQYPNLVSKGAFAGWDTDGWSLYVFRPSGGVNQIGIGIRNGATSNALSISNNLINIWIHIVGTWDGNKIRIYRNGIEISNREQTILPPQTSTNLYFGRGPSGQYFPGKIDDLRIYNYAITPEQVKQVYNGGAVNFN